MDTTKQKIFLFISQVLNKHDLEILYNKQHRNKSNTRLKYYNYEILKTELNLMLRQANLEILEGMIV